MYYRGKDLPPYTSEGLNLKLQKQFKQLWGKFLAPIGGSLHLFLWLVICITAFRWQYQHQTFWLSFTGAIKESWFPAVLWYFRHYLYYGIEFGIKRYSQMNASTQPEPKGFNLLLGESTGTLAERDHPTNLAPGQKIYLNLPDACQNIVAFGGIGSGKTTRMIQPILNQLLQQDAGGLIFDIKGDFKNAVYSLTKLHSRTIKTIGIKQNGINLLKGLTPDMSASFLKSAFYLAGGGSGDSFWIESATQLCKSALGILYFTPSAYTLEGLYHFLFTESIRNEILKHIENQPLTSEEKRRLDSYQMYYRDVYGNYEPKVQQSILATVAQVLSPFQDPALVDAFCQESPDNARIEDVLEGTIFLVDLPLAIWGLGAKAVYTFIKLRFFNVMQSRPNMPEMNQDRPAFFMCDEYQEIISASKSGISDLNFWDKSRSAKCIGIISTQSVNSFRAAIGDKTLADTILQNFRGAKICFRTEDPETINFLNSIGGKIEVQRTSTTEGTSDMGGSSSGETVSWTERPVVDAILIRQLGPNQAVALLNMEGEAWDDVLNLQPLFINR